MKKSFKKLMSLMLVSVLLISVFSITVSAAQYTVTLSGGQRTVNGITVYATFTEELQNLVGDVYTLDGVEYTLDRENVAVTFKTNNSGKYYLPDPSKFFVLPGHTTSNDTWTNGPKTTSGNNKVGRQFTVSNNNKNYGPKYTADKLTVNFFPGANGTGTTVTNNTYTYGRKITLQGAIFTRPGYVQIGWALTDGAATPEFEINQANYVVTGNVDFYPVWQQVKLGVAYDVSTMAFGSLCVGYIAPDAKTVTITNEGNADITLTLPTSTAYNITTTDSLTLAANGGQLVVTIQPKDGLAAGVYAEDLAFSFNFSELDFVVTAKFMVNNHMFIKYSYNNDATYEANGTESAICFNGCGAGDTREAEGTQKFYSADYNVADGLLPEYLYHKTVNFVAFGSGMDNKADVLKKRFRPTEWSVNDGVHSGKFAEECTTYNEADYTVKYDHKDFGQFELTIKYVEEEKQNGEWVKTGIEDTKTFKYSIGPSAEDEKEILMPNMIVKIIFGLFGYLFDLIGSGNLPF